MASFLDELWNSIFTPGASPSLLAATNATFAVLQGLLFVMLLATYSIHFLILSFLSAGLWYAINWFARELQAERAKTEISSRLQRERSLDPDSETETESAPVVQQRPPVSLPASTGSRPLSPPSDEVLRKRRSMGDSSDYLSTDSEWEKISESDERDR